MTTIDLEPLDHVTGGDAASDYGAAFNRDVHDVGTRLDRAKTAFVRGDAIGTIKQLGAADINGLRTVGDLVSPITGILGGLKW